MRPSGKIYGNQDSHFTWRGNEVMRLEYLSDIVFALAFGMIVSSGSEPRTFEELQGFLFTALPVTAAFTFMVYIWAQHFTFFRRFGLEDGRTMFLNATLLLVVLFIAYPMRFIFDSLFGWGLMMLGDDSYVADLQVDYRRSGIIMSYFAGGMMVVMGLFALLYRHALSLKDALELSPMELAITRASFWIYLVSAFWAAVACVGAAATPLGGFAGFIIGLSRPSARIIRWRMLPREPGRPRGVTAPSSPPRRTPASSPAQARDNSGAALRGR